MAGCNGIVTRARCPAPGSATAGRSHVAALGDLIIICAVGLVIAVLSLVLSKTPATLPFARRVPSSRPSATAPRRGRRVPSRPGLPVPFTTGASCSAGVSGSPGHAARQTVSTAPTTASSRPLRDSTQCLSPGQAPGQVVVRGFLLLGVRYLFAARRPSADPGPPAPGHSAPGPRSHAAQRRTKAESSGHGTASAHPPAKSAVQSTNETAANAPSAAAIRSSR